jgi:hypothetical protein
MAEPGKSDRRLWKQPFVFTSRFFTTGNGQLINGGALAAGQSRDFPQGDFNNALSRPVWVERIKFTVDRPAGGNEVDSDYSNVLIQVQDLLTSEFYQKDPTPLSVLLDRQRREWLLQPGKIHLRALGGGLKFKASVNPGAVGSPYNIEVAVHGYTEMFAETPASVLPEER